MAGRKLRPETNDIPSFRNERRESPRYRAVEEEAWLGRQVGDAFQTCRALILNVSLRGALIVADEVPETAKVWICLNGSAPTEWVEARVVGVVRSRRGPHRLRLAFETNCPYEFFKTAVYGFESLTNRIGAEDEIMRESYKIK